jgi:hypothetical protein
MAERDEHGQPLERGFNAQMRVGRTIDEMLGLCKGILADGVVVPSEAEFLRAWLRANRDLAQEWPACVLAERLEHIFDDGVVTDEEATDLRDLLLAVTGEAREADAGARKATELPLNDPLPLIEFPERRFCFTGKFIYGTRGACEAEVVRRGGRCQSTPTLKTDYLVIGVLGSRDWVHTTHGRKIEFAVLARDSKESPLAIISEEDWARALT